MSMYTAIMSFVCQMPVFALHLVVGLVVLTVVIYFYYYYIVLNVFVVITVVIWLRLSLICIVRLLAL